MIIDFLINFVLISLLVITIFANTGLLSLKDKKQVKETPIDKQSFIFKEKLQCRPENKLAYFDSEFPEIKMPTPSLILDDSGNPTIPEQPTPYFGQFAIPLVTSADSSATVQYRILPQTVIIDFSASQVENNLEKIESIRVDLAEPKDLLAKNLNEELKEKIDFYSENGGETNSRRI